MELDDYWQLLRIRSGVFEKYFTGSSVSESLSPGFENSVENRLYFSDALRLYLEVKHKDKPPQVHQYSKRAFKYLKRSIGDKALTDIGRSDANTLRDYLIDRDLAGSSVDRIFSTLSAVFNYACLEYDLGFRNPFQNVLFDKKKGTKTRASIPLVTIKYIQDRCVSVDDERRWLVALIADSGMRLGEAAGLLCSDIKLAAPIPHISLQPYHWRPLKTKASQREVPLVGSSLWAAQRVLNETKGSNFAFPSYNKSVLTNSNSASAALNKWLKAEAKSSYTIHGFRHALRDRLRAVECPKDIADQIGGWSTKSVGESYGEGYKLDLLFKWMKKFDSFSKTPERILKSCQ